MDNPRNSGLHIQEQLSIDGNQQRLYYLRSTFTDSGATQEWPLLCLHRRVPEEAIVIGQNKKSDNKYCVVKRKAVNTKPKGAIAGAVANLCCRLGYICSQLKPVFLPKTLKSFHNQII